MIEVKITNEQKVLATLAPKSAAGKPAKIDGVPTWEVTLGDATIEVVAGGLSAWLISGDAAAESKILVSADADLGTGVENITQEISLDVSLSKTTDLGLTLAAPVAK